MPSSHPIRNLHLILASCVHGNRDRPQTSSLHRLHVVFTSMISTSTPYAVHTCFTPAPYAQQERLRLELCGSTRFQSTKAAAASKLLSCSNRCAAFVSKYSSLYLSVDMLSPVGTTSFNISVMQRLAVYHYVTVTRSKCRLPRAQLLKPTNTISRHNVQTGVK